MLMIISPSLTTPPSLALVNTRNNLIIFEYFDCFEGGPVHKYFDYVEIF